MSRRKVYMDALEQASVHGNISPLAKFIAEELAQVAALAPWL